MPGTPISGDERMLMLLLAFVHLQQGTPQKAETLYAALLALDPGDTAAAKGLAWAQLESGHPKAALATLDRITGPMEPSAVVQLLRARALAQTSQIDDARVAMRAFNAARDRELTSKAPAPTHLNS